MNELDDLRTFVASHSAEITGVEQDGDRYIIALKGPNGVGRILVTREDLDDFEGGRKADVSLRIRHAISG